MKINRESLNDVFGTLAASLIVGVIVWFVHGFLYWAFDAEIDWRFYLPIVGGMCGCVLTRIYTLNERLRKVNIILDKSLLELKSKFQDRVMVWLVYTFPMSVVNDKRERGFRFCEESLELSQAAGLTEKEVLKLVAYVFSRPIGKVGEEIGGVGTTLSSLCSTFGLDMEDCFNEELDYKCWPNAAAIKAKHDSKTNKSSPLPGEAG